MYKPSLIVTICLTIIISGFPRPRGKQTASRPTGLLAVQRAASGSTNVRMTFRELSSRVQVQPDKPLRVIATSDPQGKRRQRGTSCVCAVILNGLSGSARSRDDPTPPGEFLMTEAVPGQESLKRGLALQGVTAFSRAPCVPLKMRCGEAHVIFHL